MVCEGAVGPAPVLHKTSKTLSRALCPMALLKDWLPLSAKQRGDMAANGSHARMPVGAHHPGMIDGVCGVVCEGAVGRAPALHKNSYALNLALSPLVFVKGLLQMLAKQKSGMAANGSHTRMSVGTQHPGMIG